jgi:serine/threonine protein kinase
VDVYALKRLLFANGWTLEEFRKETCVTKATARRLMAGGPARMSTIRSIAQDLGVEPIDLIDASEYERPQETKAVTPKVELREWITGRPLTEIKTTSNGLQYRIFRMQHRHQPTRFGRGKRYEFAHLADSAQEQLKNRFVRHMEVCDRIGRHPQFPTCYATYPEPGERVWWVIDEWVDGLTLAGRLAAGPPSLPVAAKWSSQLAAGLSAMHSVGIVRRDLSPENILVREADESLLLTDFELAKLAGNLPTVSDQWPDDSYRAPEIGAGEPTPAADLYSWGRIVTHLVAGELPPREKESSSLVKRLPKPVFELITACTALRQSQRPASFDKVLPIMVDWVKSQSKEPNHGK